MGDVWNCAFRELSRRRSRTFAVCLGYVITIGIMVGMIHLLLFSQAAEEEIINHTGVFFMAFSPVLSGGASTAVDLLSKDGDVLAALSATGDRGEETFVANSIVTKPLPLKFVGDIKKLPSVKEVSPFLVFRMRSVPDGHFFTIGGFELGNKAAVGTNCCAKADVVKGSYFSTDQKPKYVNGCCPVQTDVKTVNGGPGPLTPEEIKDCYGSVMVEEGYASMYDIAIGSEVVIAGLKFPVVGIVNPGIRPAKADIYMTYEDARMAINRVTRPPIKEETNLFLVETESSSLQQEAMDEVKKIINGSVINTYACFRPAAKIVGINQRAVKLLIGLMIIGSILLSLKSQLTSVIERRRDIGILKALGWTNREVMSQLIIESMFVSLIGGILGDLLGGVIFHFTPVKMMTGLNTQLEPSIYPMVIFLGASIAIISGGIAGIIPAFVAASQSPAEAMRRV